MSTFIIFAVNKKTKKRHQVTCLDDFFGPHIYGYAIDGSEPLTQEQFERDYEDVKS